jgi:hypothetical protein
MVIISMDSSKGTAYSLGSEVKNRMKIKCMKLECSVCQKAGLAQIFSNNKGEVKYTRIRHYSHNDKVSHKPQFTYCKIEDLETLKALIKSKGISLSIDEVKKGQLG